MHNKYFALNILRTQHIGYCAQIYGKILPLLVESTHGGVQQMHSPRDIDSQCRVQLLRVILSIPKCCSDDTAHVLTGWRIWAHQIACFMWAMGLNYAVLSTLALIYQNTKHILKFMHVHSSIYFNGSPHIQVKHACKCFAESRTESTALKTGHLLGNVRKNSCSAVSRCVRKGGNISRCSL